MAQVPSPNYMGPPTPLSGDFSRPALKRLATWIRDDLDLLVAREGPGVLRPDDVLALHDEFIALQHAHNITLLDLRATGIHKAVQDIAGVATRWPGRLCEDCDKVIRIWKTKFGSFSEIHPFLYGRGGRLEGIATPSQYSRQELLTRWSQLCPEAIHPKRSHRLGDLEFHVGTWWINPLFAHHAGIIGLEACEGGTTYDKNGAYALVLKGSGEVDAGSEESFTYRVPQNDKGKFRLTAATPKSRDPIRILRSHSINSIWGPKAGIRYEGLYSVKGWSIKQAKTADIANGQWKEGDILYDIKFERCDLVSLSEAIKRPTATEVDDYLEYKRLRKLYRQGTRNINAIVPEMTDDTAPVRLAPAISSIQPQPTPILPGRPVSPIRSRDSIFKKPNYDKKSHLVFTAHGGLNFMTIPDNNASPFTKTDSSLLKVPLRADARLADSSLEESSLSGSPDGSQASSLHTGASAQSNIKEVAPWIDYDTNLVLPELLEKSPYIRDRNFSHSLKPNTEPKRNAEPPSPTPRPPYRDRKNSMDFKALSPSATKTYEKKFTSLRNRNAIAKLFDGSMEETSESVFDFDRDAICPPNDWDLTPGFKAVSLEDPAVLMGVENSFDWLFTDPFVEGMKKRRERQDSSAVAPDEIVGKA